MAAGLRRGVVLQDVRLPDRLGALIARRRTLDRLRRPWFSGGTVVAANVQGAMVERHSGHAVFEDGTVDYLGIPAVEIGLRRLERIGMDTITQRVEALGSRLLERLQRLTHPNGRPRSVSTDRFTAFASEFAELTEVPTELPPRPAC